MLGTEPHRSLCGWSVERVTDHREAVTCRSCIRRMPGMPAPAATFSWRDVVEYVLGVVAGARVPEYPALSRGEWPLMRCRYQGAAIETCGCAYCDWERRYRPRVDEWERSQSLRPHRRYEHPFGSLNAALDFLHRWRTEALGVRSYQGPLQERAAKVEALGGVEVQTTRRFDRDPLEIERAGMAADLQRALDLALADEPPLGEDATERAHAARETRLRRALTVELAALGIIPLPRDRARLGREIEALRRELEARVVG